MNEKYRILAIQTIKHHHFYTQYGIKLFCKDISSMNEIEDIDIYLMTTEIPDYNEYLSFIAQINHVVNPNDIHGYFMVHFTLITSAEELPEHTSLVDTQKR